MKSLIIPFRQNLEVFLLLLIIADQTFDLFKNSINHDRITIKINQTNYNDKWIVYLKEGNEEWYFI